MNASDSYPGTSNVHTSNIKLKNTILFNTQQVFPKITIRQISEPQNYIVNHKTN